MPFVVYKRRASPPLSTQWRSIGRKVTDEFTVPVGVGAALVRFIASAPAQNDATQVEQIYREKVLFCVDRSAPDRHSQRQR
jgi:hypothetical protein